MSRPRKLDDGDVVSKYKELKVKGSRGTDVVGKLAESCGASKAAVYSALRRSGVYKPRADKSEGV